MASNLIRLGPKLLTDIAHEPRLLTGIKNYVSILVVFEI